MGAVEELIKNNPIYKKEQSTRMDMEGRVPNEPWSEEEKLIAKRLLYAGPKPYIPARIKGAGVNATRLQAIPEDWSKMRSSQILTQASKEMKELGIGWWDTVDNDKELQATVNYIRNAGKDDDDDDYVPEPEPVRNEESYEAPEDVQLAQKRIDEFKELERSGDLFNTMLGPRASGHPTKSYMELSEDEKPQGFFESPETFIRNGGRDEKGGSFLDDYLLNEKQALKEELLKELLA